MNRFTSCFLAGLWLAQPLSASAWTNQIDCEGGTLLGKVLEGATNAFSSTFSKTVYVNTPLLGGKQACRMGIAQGSDGWGEFGATYSFPSKLTRGMEIWTRVNMYVPTGFDVRTTTGMLKFIRIHTASSSGGNDGYHDLLISHPGASFWETGRGDWSASYIYSYEGFPKLIGVGTSGVHDVARGKWESYEIYIKLDSVAKNAGGTGLVRIWKNNTLMLTRSDSPTLVGSGSYADGFYLFTYWNGNAPVTQSLYVDSMVVTSDTPTGRDAAGNPFIGGAIGPAPMPPSGTTVQ